MSNLFNRIKKHKTKLLFVGGITVALFGTYRLSRYIQNYRQVGETDNSLNFRILKAQYFQSMLTNSLKITKNLLKSFEKEMKATMDSENVALNLGIDRESGDGDFNKENYDALTPEMKLELWQKLKVLSLTKATVLMLCWSYLTVTIHIQISILAGHLFAQDNGSKTVDLISSIQRWLFSPVRPSNLDENFQKDFINFTVTQLKQQIPRWISIVQDASFKVIGKMSLKKIVTPDEIINNLEKVRKTVQDDIFALCLQGIQLHNLNKRLEGPMYITLMDVFQHSGLIHIELLMDMFQIQVCDILKRSVKSYDVENSSKIPLAKLVPFMWSIFSTEENNASMMKCVVDFCSKSDFRSMIFKTYEGCINF